MMCLILALIAISSPVLIVVFRGVIQKEGRIEAETETETASETGGGA